MDIRVGICEFMDFGERAVVWHLYSLEVPVRDGSAMRLLILQHGKSPVSCMYSKIVRTAMNRQKQFMRR